jgi:3',5'-cyclic-AMP phosphodiesterase
LPREVEVETLAQTRSKTHDEAPLRAGPGGVMRPLRLIQITDLHLFGDPAGRLLGLTTRRSFESVLAHAMAGAGGDGPPLQALALTGDLVHDESPEGYAYLGRVLESTGLPCYCIPGNHDRRELMEAHLGAAAVGQVAGRRLGEWHLVFLDSTVAGRDGGRLGFDQLRCLEALLAAEPSHTLIFLHQHPVPVGSAWMDTMGVENGDELIALCARHPQVKALLCGHIHQELSVTRGTCQVLGSPSTCVQFLPGSQAFALDRLPPGHRELLLYPDGRLETWVVRLPEYPERLDLRAEGY